MNVTHLHRNLFDLAIIASFLALPSPCYTMISTLLCWGKVSQQRSSCSENGSAVVRFNTHVLM